ncbi:hypothetical protein B0H14DRAFT_3514244 [Mycena olivaceomarginata]|nr:hypothetical protein B0H14DRAFT_3514244 [Mycena olivaceomarginata]
MQALKAHAQGERIALDGSFGIPQVDVRTPTPPPRDPLADSDEDDDELPTLAKGKGKVPPSSPFKRARSPTDEESVSNKRARRKVKPTDSDADYVSNADSEDQDELADDAEQSEDGADARGSPEGHDEQEEEEGEAQQEEPEVRKPPPKKAAKGKAKAAPAPPVSPLFAGPPLSVEAVQVMPVERVGHSLVTEAAKPPFLHKGPPACTNCISRGHDCQPCETGRTNRCQRCHDGHMVCSRGRTAPELLSTFERLRPVLAVAPSTLNMALISLVMARRELDLQWIQVTRLSAQYNQQMQELVDVLLQQADAFHADFVRHFYEDETDREVLQGILERGLQSSTALSRHQDRYARHPVTPVVHNRTPTANEPEYSYTRLLPSAAAPLGALEDLPNVAAEDALQYLANVAGPSTAPGHTLVGPAVPPFDFCGDGGVENAGL